MISEDLVKHLQNASQWVCACGEHADPMSPDWRWNGRDWEHHHDYPAGHVTATRIPEPK